METLDFKKPNSIESNKKRQERIEEIYQNALNEPRNKENYKSLLEQNPGKEFEIKETIENLLTEMEKVEFLSERKIARDALTTDVAKKITAIWDLSGSGNYNEPEGNDPYKGISWARWSDRKRTNYSAWLTRIIAEMKASGEKTKGLVNSVDPVEIRAIIEKYGPTILYGAFTSMNQVLQDVVNKPNSIIPPDKVIIDAEERLNTVSQVKNFSLPKELHRSNTEIAVVASGPHLVRLMHMLKSHPTVPSDMHIRLCPLKTKVEGWKEYTLMEIRGLLYYIYLSKDHDADKEPYPYIIHGEK